MLGTGDVLCLTGLGTNHPTYNWRQGREGYRLGGELAFRRPIGVAVMAKCSMFLTKALRQRTSWPDLDPAR